MVRLLSLIIAFILCCGSWSTSWAELEVSASRNRISLNDTLQLKVVFQGDSDDELDLSALEQDFDIVGRSTSSQLQIINGSMSRTKLWAIGLLPKRSGRLTIPQLCLDNDCSRPLTIEVSDQPPTAADGAEVLLETELTPQRGMVQQQLLYRVRLFHRLPLVQGSLEPPQPQGVETLVQKLGDDRRYETYRDGWHYQVVERSYALFPQQSGKLRLAPQLFEGQLQAESRRRFDPFGDQGRVVRLRSDPKSLEIEPPASNQHRWLPAHGIMLEDSWQHTPPTLTVGEPATRTLTLRAAGLMAAQLPELPLTPPDSFKSYPDQALREDVVDPNGISGVIEQKVALVPTHAGSFELPAISLPWWDVEQQQWRIASVPPLTVQVLPAQRQVQTLPAVPPAPPAAMPQASEPKDATPAAATALLSPPSTEPQRLWMAATLLCAVGWLSTTLLWLRARRPHSAVATARKDPRQGDLTAARKQTLTAARNHDPQATRTALLIWGRLLWPQQATMSLEWWQQHSDTELTELLAQLSAHLYAAQPQPWNGDALARALQQWQPPTLSTPKGTLPSFYPPAQ